MQKNQKYHAGIKEPIQDKVGNIGYLLKHEKVESGHVMFWLKKRIGSNVFLP